MNFTCNGLRIGRLHITWRDPWPPVSYGLEVAWYPRQGTPYADFVRGFRSAK